MMNRTPVAGHISSLRAAKKEKEKEIKTTIKDASKKHIDPRTGLVQEGPSEMGPSGKAVKNGTQYYNVDNKNQNGHGENGNGYDYDDESNAVSGKLDINLKENNNQKNSKDKNSQNQSKSNTPPPKTDAKPPKSKKTSGIRRVFSLGSSSSKNSNSELNDKTSNDDLTSSNSNSTAAKSSEVPKQQNHPQNSASQQRSRSSSEQIHTTHYLVEDSAYGSMDLIKKW